MTATHFRLLRAPDHADGQAHRRRNIRLRERMALGPAEVGGLRETGPQVARPLFGTPTFGPCSSAVEMWRVFSGERGLKRL